MPLHRIGVSNAQALANPGAPGTFTVQINALPAGYIARRLILQFNLSAITHGEGGVAHYHEELCQLVTSVSLSTAGAYVPQVVGVRGRALDDLYRYMHATRHTNAAGLGAAGETGQIWLDIPLSPPGTDEKFLRPRASWLDGGQVTAIMDLTQIDAADVTGATVIMTVFAQIEKDFYPIVVGGKELTAPLPGAIVIRSPVSLSNIDTHRCTDYANRLLVVRSRSSFSNLSLTVGGNQLYNQLTPDQIDAFASEQRSTPGISGADVWDAKVVQGDPLARGVPILSAGGDPSTEDQVVAYDVRNDKQSSNYDLELRANALSATTALIECGWKV